MTTALMPEMAGVSADEFEAAYAALSDEDRARLIQAVGGNGVLTFKEFATRVNPRYQWYPHCRVIANVLQRVADKELKRVLFLAPPRTGKALALDTPIPTPTGWRQIGELRPGDLVLDWRRNPTRVRSVSPVWRDRPVFAVSARGWRAPIIADAAHEWPVAQNVDGSFVRCETRALPGAGGHAAEPAGTADTVCIEVEHPDHLFLAGHGEVPTCNSEPISRMFPAYWLYRYPYEWVGLTSYTSSLATTLSRSARANYSHFGGAGALADDSKGVMHWETAQRGGMWCAGFGGSILGRGMHCFPAGTLVTTDHGNIPIEDLAVLGPHVQILAYDHQSNRTVFRRTQAVASRQAAGLYRVTTTTGRVVEATGDHPIWTARGYVRVDRIAAGDSLLCVVPAVIRATRERCNEGAGQAMPRALLRERLLSGTPRGEERTAVSPVPRSGVDENKSSLRSVPSRIAGHPGVRPSRSRRDVPDVQRHVSREVARQEMGEVRRVLFQPMFQQSAFAPDEREGQPEVEAWRDAVARATALGESVPRHEAAGPREGRGRMRRMRADGQTARPPHRQLADEQRIDESRDAVRLMPPAAASCDGVETIADTVAMVERLRAEPTTVYDIQVEEDHNFFANGILVHNCGIIDDPIKSSVEAQSLKIAERNLDFWKSTWTSRLEPDGAIVVVMQRWPGVADLVQQLFELEQGDEPDRWHVVCLEGEKEAEPLQIPATCTLEPDWRTVVGEPLCPERLTVQRMAQMRSRSPFYFAAQVQQRPVPRDSAMFQRDKVKIVAEGPKTAKLRRARFWDKASTEGGGKYTAGCLMSIDTTDGIVYIENMARAQKDTLERRKLMRSVAEIDGREVEIYVEQEPGPIWEDELVTMASGSRTPLREVKVGDRVVNADGNAVGVTAVHVQGLLPTIRIMTDSGRTIHAAGNHPFLLPTGWVDADKLAVGDMLAARATRAVESPPASPSFEECRLAGYFVGDGCCTFIKSKGQETRGINANVVCSDPEEGIDIQRCTSSIGTNVLVTGTRGWTYSMSGTIRDWLRNRGLAGKRTENKRVPEWVMSASDQHIAHFLGAYFACDGTVSMTRTHPSVEMYSICRPLLEDVQHLMVRLGIFSVLRERRWSEWKGQRQRQYRLTLRNADDAVARFAGLVPVWHSRKRPMLASFRRRAFDTPYLSDEIIAIDHAGLLPCRCLTVEDGASFLVNDIVVHNSSGVDSVRDDVRNLSGFSVRPERVTGSKPTRAEPLASQWQAGNVRLVAGTWNKNFLDEIELFPNGTYSDQVDAASGAYNKLSRGGVWVA